MFMESKKKTILANYVQNPMNLKIDCKNTLGKVLTYCFGVF